MGMKTHFLKVLNMRFGLRTLHFYLKGSLQVRDAIVSAVRNSGVTAAQKLVESYLRIVTKVVVRYS